MAPTTPPRATPGTVIRSGDSGPQIASHRQHFWFLDIKFDFEL